MYSKKVRRTNNKLVKTRKYTKVNRSKKRVKRTNKYKNKLGGAAQAAEHEQVLAHLRRQVNQARDEVNQANVQSQTPEIAAVDKTLEEILNSHSQTGRSDNTYKDLNEGLDNLLKKLFSWGGIRNTATNDSTIKEKHKINATLLKSIFANVDTINYPSNMYDYYIKDDKLYSKQYSVGETINIKNKGNVILLNGGKLKKTGPIKLKKIQYDVHQDKYYFLLEGVSPPKDEATQYKNPSGKLINKLQGWKELKGKLFTEEKIPGYISQDITPFDMESVKNVYHLI